MQRYIFGDDHEAFRASCREFLDRHARPYVDEHLEARAIPREFWLEAGKQGLLGLEVPEEYGGAGAGDYRFNAVLAEELSKVNAALSSCVGIHADIVAPYLVDLCTDEQKQRWLPGFCSGEILTAIAMTEPSGGSDLAALKTTAVRDGDGWLINGSKTFITNGYSADLIVVAARTSPEKKAKGITLFAIEAGMSGEEGSERSGGREGRVAAAEGADDRARWTGTNGFSRGRKLDKVGQTESDTAELFFEDVRVGPEQVIGEVDRGFVSMMERLPQERLGAGVSNIAHAAQILRETVEYAKERKAFGQSIGAFQHNKFLLAELVTKIEVAQAFIDQCVEAHRRRELSATDAAKAKWWSAEVQNDVLDSCVQLHGGYGFMNEYRVARAWRDARVTKIWAGSNEIMKELIGRELGF
ncbi:acyl-CoA dehydrogenase family protein [Solicola gregarius]|uniref:Acyl-CoA dehydrogenase family protein n=1 Tax=Solicola gregarius TaxID=2908642 RepID=A0AA46YJE6_9ACTN|nr:acyl-CoA dehydrogenase family protein [Solicola gregarius]UYM04257.1 acyl-CoA dehydrogenase family protein [Solicola gregarius]